MKVARIAYANTEPYFHYWKSNEFELHPGVPKELANAAKRGDVIAGPLPLVECWALEDKFEPLGPWGIAAREKSRSVFVLSHRPFSELHNVTIGVTKESSTSVVLCDTLIREKYGHEAIIRSGLNLEDDAWLVIGDQALQLASTSIGASWPVVTDLATEWWNWKQLPFVFARWVVRKDLALDVRERLTRTLEESLAQGMKNIPAIAQESAEGMKLTPEFLTRYLKGLVYELDADADKTDKMFRAMVEKSSPGLVTA